MLNGNIVTDKSILFAMNEPICHELKVDPTSDKILKVWVKEPTWLEVEKAMAALMKIDAKKQKSVNLKETSSRYTNWQ